MHQQLGTLTARWLMDLFLGLLVTPQIESNPSATLAHGPTLGLWVTSSWSHTPQFVISSSSLLTLNSPHMSASSTEHAVGGRVGIPIWDAALGHHNFKPLSCQPPQWSSSKATSHHNHHGAQQSHTSSHASHCICMARHGRIGACVKIHRALLGNPFTHIGATSEHSLHLFSRHWLMQPFPSLLHSATNSSLIGLATAFNLLGG